MSKLAGGGGILSPSTFVSSPSCVSWASGNTEGWSSASKPGGGGGGASKPGGGGGGASKPGGGGGGASKPGGGVSSSLGSSTSARSS